jgi:UDP-2-acetamido-2,6-beta-L-arabino-hexul-4-ose reductase
VEVLVTGAKGFIGQNLVAWLARVPDCEICAIDRSHTPSELETALARVDFVFHLAGVNRPDDEAEFRTGNAELTARICELLQERDQAVPVVLASSIQALQENPYGISKREAEETLEAYSKRSGAYAAIYRFKNVFGKWCRPNYNSVVATFCHNVAHGLPVSVSDPERSLQLIYIDDVVQHLLGELECAHQADLLYREVKPVHEISLGRLLDLVRGFHEMRHTVHTPDLQEPFTRKLHATYTSYLPEDDLAYDLDEKSDERGVLAEFAKGGSFGQFFVSRTAPGVTRGNHYHHTKTEKFLLLAGQGLIRLRRLGSQDVTNFEVSGTPMRVVQIPPGYAHSIENVGTEDLITLFWASEEFDPTRPDTYALKVLEDEE